MGIVVILIAGALVVMTTLFIRSRLKIRKMLRETKSKEKLQIYEEVNQSEIIDSMKNVAYEPPSLPQRRQT
jgi:glutaminase